MNKPTKDLLSQAIDNLQEAEGDFEDGNEYPGHAHVALAQTKVLIVIASQIEKLVNIYEDHQK